MTTRCHFRMVEYSRITHVEKGRRTSHYGNPSNFRWFINVVSLTVGEVWSVIKRGSLGQQFVKSFVKVNVLTTFSIYSITYVSQIL